jgi:hypothetical protein
LAATLSYGRLPGYLLGSSQITVSDTSNCSNNGVRHQQPFYVKYRQLKLARNNCNIPSLHRLNSATKKLNDRWCLTPSLFSSSERVIAWSLVSDTKSCNIPSLHRLNSATNKLNDRWCLTPSPKSQSLVSDTKSCNIPSLHRLNRATNKLNDRWCLTPSLAISRVCIGLIAPQIN